MTEAGWTSNAPTKEGWYWWQRTENDNPVVVWVNTFHPDKQLRAEMISGRRELLTHFSGLFKGPISPDSYQQGRVAGLREAARAICMYCNDPHNWAPMSNSGYHICNTPGPNHTRCRATLIHALLAQQAQDEKGVGDGRDSVNHINY